MIFLLSITLPIFIMIFYILHQTKNQAKTTPPPGPPPLPFIGNLHQVRAAGNLHLYLHQLSKKYGPIIHMKLGSVPLLVISSSKLAKQVLKNQDLAFCSRPKFLGQQKLTYNASNLTFSPYNEYWREMRKVAHFHLLSPKKVQSFRPLRDKEISRMITKISEYQGAVNLSEMAMALNYNLICRIALGKGFDEDGSEKRRFLELMEDFQGIMISFFVSDYFPTFGWVDHLSGLISRVEAIGKNLDSFYQGIIDEHLDPRRERKKEEEEDVLDILIKLKEEKSSPIDLTWDHIKSLLQDILIDAIETSASSIIWTMTSLIKAPTIMEKLQHEIRSLVGKKGKVDEDDLPKLPYLKAVVNESLRLYPPAPLLIPRETMEACNLEGYEIRPKTLVYVNAYAIGRDPEYWENADEFVPERFLNSNIDVKGKDFEVIPFGSGRRICPGMFMALTNVELTIANMLYSFDWKLPKGIFANDVDTDSTPGLVVHKKNALLLVPKKYGV